MIYILENINSDQMFCLYVKKNDCMYTIFYFKEISKLFHIWGGIWNLVIGLELLKLWYGKRISHLDKKHYYQFASISNVYPCGQFQNDIVRFFNYA